MKKFIAVLSLSVLMAGTTYAQQEPQKERKQRTEQRGERVQKHRKSPEEMAAKRTEKLTQKYDLSKSQQRKLQALNLKHAQEKHALHANRGEARNHRSARGEMQASRARYEAELKDIMNKKQYAQYEADKAEKRARHDQKREHRKAHKGERQQHKS
ncbi:DUF4890 domain-containing protein [Pontibacter cellulosilyticus]|uniref:DUF4890 domain-containing protein n=1 Tax=Pontibacter cellulosilyticus TaxID=1720253 RepID=A0A923N9K0_9BACT|nr:DUF4890 domain-containing protein [Pontibacter cellulosilyticus]MBC5994714.1 hypothetical protein [Pontibacter cellulosilyticus]